MNKDQYEDRATDQPWTW